MRTRAGLLALAFAAAAAGCSSKIAKVKGKVTCDGKPFYPASILFSPLGDDPNAKETGKAAYGNTDADGNYELTTYKPGDGVLVGRHRVNVNVEFPDQAPCKGYDRAEIVVTVAPGDNVIDFKLDEYQKAAKGKK